MGEDVAADGLDDVFYDFGTVCFDAVPFFCGGESFVGDGFTAVFICGQAGADVVQGAAGGEADMQEARAVAEVDAMDSGFCVHGDGVFGGAVDGPP